MKKIFFPGISFKQLKRIAGSLLFFALPLISFPQVDTAKMRRDALQQAKQIQDQMTKQLKEMGVQRSQAHFLNNQSLNF